MEMINTIKEVLYKIHDGEIFVKPAYAFSTNEVVYVEDSESEVTDFRLEYDDNGDVTIHVLEGEEYWINEDVTYLFDGTAILKLCEVAEDIPDVTEEYLEWYSEQDNDEYIFNVHISDKENDDDED